MANLTFEAQGQVESTSTQEVVTGNFNEVKVSDGENTVTLRGKITEIIRKLGTSTAAAIKVTTPDGQAKVITSMNSPELVDESGKDRPAPKGATYEPVYQGSAA